MSDERNARTGLGRAAERSAARGPGLSRDLKFRFSFAEHGARYHAASKEFDWREVQCTGASSRTVLFDGWATVRRCASEQVNPIPLFANPAKDGAPARTKAKLRSYLLEWYHPRETAVNCGNHGYTAAKGGPAAHSLLIQKTNMIPVCGY